mmetsp:Transcript_24232/g.57410  ORF Transcript_24232/g.57410 Transcript_24232/m.57410 type:complete len:251 (-) Transcript_24232:1090-1842(-)
MPGHGRRAAGERVRRGASRGGGGAGHAEATRGERQSPASSVHHLGESEWPVGAGVLGAHSGQLRALRSLHLREPHASHLEHESRCLAGPGLPGCSATRSTASGHGLLHIPDGQGDQRSSGGRSQPQADALAEVWQQPHQQRQLHLQPRQPELRRALLVGRGPRAPVLCRGPQTDAQGPGAGGESIHPLGSGDAGKCRGLLPVPAHSREPHPRAERPGGGQPELWHLLEVRSSAVEAHQSAEPLPPLLCEV